MAASDDNQSQNKQKVQEDSSRSQDVNSSGQDMKSQSIQPKTINEDQQNDKSLKKQENHSSPDAMNPQEQTNKPSPSPQTGDEQSPLATPPATPKNENLESEKITSEKDNPSASGQDRSIPSQSQPVSPDIQKSDSIPQSELDSTDEKQNERKEDQKANDPTTTSPQSGSPKYKIVLGVLVVFAIVGLAFAGYQFYQSRYADQSEEVSQDQQTQQNQQDMGPQISLENGNVISTSSDGQKAILINKTSFDTTGITGFTDLRMSPNSDKFCFHTSPPSPESAVYVSDISGGNVQEAGRDRTDCRWLEDNQTIVYEEKSDENEPVNIFKFDTSTGEESLLTGGAPEGVVRYYQIEDIEGITVLCSFETDTSTEPTECSIDTQNEEVSITLE